MPLRSSLARSVGKLLRVFSNEDLSLRGDTQDTRLPGPPAPMAASGGVENTPGNGYKYHTFLHPTSDNFVVSDLSVSAPKNICDILVVAGGASNSTPAPYTGGAGAGAVCWAQNVTLTEAKTYAITVGDGGATGPGIRNNGADSVFTGHPVGDITAKGGGFGGYYSTTVGNPGGCGGGAQDSPPPGSQGPGSTIQPTQNPAWVPQPGFAQYGTAGGQGVNTGAYHSAGGGGAGEAGGNAPGPPDSAPGGYGGRGTPIPGFEYPIIGMSPVAPTLLGNSPTNNHFGGGGAGWGYAGYPNARVRAWGGGGVGAPVPGPQGAVYGNSTGTDGLGGGGGGGTGGGGGSGCVIIRYPS